MLSHGAPSGDSVVIRNLICEMPETKLVEAWLFGHDKKHADSSIKYRFEIKYVDTVEPVLINKDLWIRSVLRKLEHKDGIEFFHFYNRSYIENFELDKKSMKMTYTQIYHYFGSSAQYYIANGRCNKNSSND